VLRREPRYPTANHGTYPASVAEDKPARWGAAIGSRVLAAGIFWWLVVRTWFWWVTVILLIGALTSTALVVLFVWARSRQHAAGDGNAA
jgi:hypothetical protein